MKTLAGNVGLGACWRRSEARNSSKLEENRTTNHNPLIVKIIPADIFQLIAPQLPSKARSMSDLTGKIATHVRRTVAAEAPAFSALNLICKRSRLFDIVR